MGWNTINVWADIDIDVDDVIHKIPTMDLENELRGRAESNYVNTEVEDFISLLAGFPEFTLSNDEVCECVLRALGRI